MDALEELLLFDVVARSVPLGHRVELNGPPRHHRGEAVGVVGDLLAQVALDRLQDLVVHPALGPALRGVDINLAFPNDVNPLLS